LSHKQADIKRAQSSVKKEEEEEEEEDMFISISIQSCVNYI